MKAYAFLSTLMLVISAAAGEAGAAEAIRGQARVIDGDTIQVGEQRIRLAGIDAPERAQYCGPVRCGEVAKSQADKLLQGRTVTCIPEGGDKYGRMVASCGITIAGDLQENLVRGGYAISTAEYDERYWAAEQEACRAKRGIWATGFQLPADYRKRSSEFQSGCRTYQDILEVRAAKKIKRYIPASR